MTISSPNVINTTLIQDLQADGSVTAARMRVIVDSLSGLPSSTQVTAGASAYTLALADRGTRIRYNNVAAGTFTIPPNSSVAFDVDTEILFCQVNTGQLTLLAGVGVTLRTPSSLTTRSQWSTIAIHQDAANVWVASGDLT